MGTGTTTARRGVLPMILETGGEPRDVDWTAWGIRAASAPQGLLYVVWKLPRDADDLTRGAQRWACRYVDGTLKPGIPQFRRGGAHELGIVVAPIAADSAVAVNACIDDFRQNVYGVPLRRGDQRGKPIRLPIT